MYWEPVADGVQISAEALGDLYEDQSFNINVSYYSLDEDGSEYVGEWAFIQFNDERVELVGYEKMEGPFTFQGQTLSWYYIVSAADLGSLQILPPQHWHGDITGSLFMNGTEILAPNPTVMSKGTFKFTLKAVADKPLLTAPLSTVYVLENEQVPIPNLSAALVDTITENGAEYMAIVFEGVPEDSFFLNSQGQRVGEPSTGGLWTIFDAADLEGIEFKPPLYWSGHLILNLTATVVELSNGDTIIHSIPFDILIEPVASPFEILTNDVELPGSGSADLSLNIILLDDRGSDLGENPAEIIELTFTDVPDSTFLRSSFGGSLVNNAAGTWTFTGTQEQSNAIQIVNSNATAQTHYVTVIGKTIDVGNELGAALSDDFSFRVFVRKIVTPGVKATAMGTTLVGTDGNDVLYGSAVADQNIVGQGGMDVIYSAPERKIMSGGTGADQFVWRSMTDLQGAMDEITDFKLAEGDQLNVGGLLPNFDIQMDSISDYIRLVDFSPSSYSVVEINDGGVWKPVVRLDEVTGTTAQEFWTSGNLLV
jgi:hypothetical protein